MFPEVQFTNTNLLIFPFKHLTLKYLFGGFKSLVPAQALDVDPNLN